jgi:hypothetical protein
LDLLRVSGILGLMGGECVELISKVVKEFPIVLERERNNLRELVRETVKKF